MKKNMKIMFVCGSLVEGRDGVGDYTRKLAAYVSRENIVSIVSLNDKGVEDCVRETQKDDDCEIPVIRMSSKQSWSAKARQLRKELATFDPDWVSLQYVAYSFHHKGLPLAMTLKIAPVISSYRVHIMFHELWLAGPKGAPWKWRLIGFLQTKMVKMLIAKSNAEVLNTSVKIYLRMMERAGIAGNILPIFSNISNHSPTLTSDTPQIAIEIMEGRNDYIIGCNFGSFYNNHWDLADFLPVFEEECLKSGKKPLIYSVGKVSYGAQAWEELKMQFPGIKFVTLGPVSQQELSYLFNFATDFGIITTPALLAGKSGSFMAFKEHGLYCFCKANGLKYDFNIDDVKVDLNLIIIDNKTRFSIPGKTLPVNQVEFTGRSFINYLTTNSSYE